MSRRAVELLQAGINVEEVIWKDGTDGGNTTQLIWRLLISDNGTEYNEIDSLRQSAASGVYKVSTYVSVLRFPRGIICRTIR